MNGLKLWALVTQGKPHAPPVRSIVTQPPTQEQLQIAELEGEVWVPFVPAGAQVPPGYKLVPVEATPEMIAVAVERGAAGEYNEGIWTAMLATAPEAPAQTDEDHVVVCWNHDRTRILAVTRQNAEGQILKVIAEAPTQAEAPSEREALLPCPHCGEQPIEHAIEAHKHELPFAGVKMPDHPGSHVVECGCGAGMIDDTREAVLARWNRRAALASQPQAFGDLTGVRPCCGDFANCHRACTPRGRWQASQPQAVDAPSQSQIDSLVNASRQADEGPSDFVRRVWDAARRAGGAA